MATTSAPGGAIERTPSDFLRRTAAFFLPLAVLATATCGLAYAEAQQALRSGANDPQVQLAEDAGARLDSGASPSTVVDTSSAVDLAHSLAPFVIVFGAQGQVLASNASLDGGQPAPPNGVLEAARPGSPNAVTWQPRDGLRFATVTVAWKGGTVLAGRSLRVVEEREANAELIAGAAWLAMLAALAAASVLAAWLWPRHEAPV
ncbi:MAG TPA: hypothetical protein VF349_03475 [Candidatus Limnocylindrales bacterium]